ncbi:Arc family DNA-binding protein [Aeromonas caviae]
MARKDPQFNVRMPQELKEMIEASAKDNQRSINAEIVHHLRNAMEAAGYINDDLIGAHRPVEVRHIDSSKLRLEPTDSSYQEFLQSNPEDLMERTAKLLAEINKMLSKGDKKDN